MARIPKFFYSTDTERQTLHRRIVPSADQRTFQQDRWNDLCDFLIGALEEESGYSMSSRLQGSYKFGTQIRPIGKDAEFDIDLGIYFEWIGASDDVGTSPLDFKNMVQSALNDYAQEADDEVIGVEEPPKKRCARIRFTHDFHIDVPVYHLDPDADERELATEEDEWEESDPKAFYLWFRDTFSDEDSDLVRRLIRYVKAWAALKLEKPPSSVLLTVLVGEAYQVATEDEMEGDDTALRHVAAYIADRLDTNDSVLNPVNNSENLNRLEEEEFASLVEGLRQLVDCADRALAATDELKTATVWQEMFGHFFPAPDVDEGNKALVPVQFVPEVSVYAQSRSNANVTYSGRNSVGPMVRGCTIKFTLTNANQLPVGAIVEWTARNEGTEAEFVNDLGHPAGYGTEILDSSAYHGRHFMDVVVKDSYGQVLGFRRVPVNIMDMKAPPRNAKKPGYMRYRRRR